MFRKPSLYLFGFFIVLILACQDEQKAPGTKKPNTTKKTTPKQEPEIKVDVPKFDADKSYEYIAKQVAFGPRVPGSDPHLACRDWMKSELEKTADQVTIQESTDKNFEGKTVPIYNVIASFNPKAKERILLCAHWDTRPFADQDTKDKDKPIDGANDGGSGVGVLLEIANQLKQNPVDIGVDIVLFDTEDGGMPGYADSYCLGSQYWGKEAKKSGYKAKYGILLDMVGGKNALFYQEGLSKKHGQHVLDKVWKAANTAGQSSFFSYESVSELTDDHKYVMFYTGIPTIDIIQYERFNGFGSFWHTHDDNMDVISKRTLKAVGQTVLQVLYQENARLK